MAQATQHAADAARIGDFAPERQAPFPEVLRHGVVTLVERQSPRRTEG